MLIATYLVFESVRLCLLALSCEALLLLLPRLRLSADGALIGL